MRPQPPLLIGTDVSKREPIQPIFLQSTGIDGIDREEDQPRGEPDRHKSLGHHQKESHKDIWVDSAFLQYFFWTR